MRSVFLLLLIAMPVVSAFSQDMVSDQSNAGDFPIVSGGSLVSSIYADSKDHWLVGRAAQLLADDIRRVTGFMPTIYTDLSKISGVSNLIIIGSFDQSPLIQRLSRQQLIPSTVKGKWESYMLTTVRRPIDGVDKALILAGSDRRGTAYAVFELSRQMGVSPWYWWADVPVKHRNSLFVRGNRTLESGPPAVKYRGFFINDEAPALSGWVRQQYGGFNHLFYEKVFELLLRLKANYLWPAMWGSAFNADDTLNAVMADEYGIVMGTSHHEPMLRSQQEWKRFGLGPWNYQTNEAVLDSFWRKGIVNMDSHESIVTVGMRGDGDKPMEEHSNIALLEKIVADQRAIIAGVTGKPPAATPQSWALYKEVQDYYDKGMRVPDDVTLLLCDDNWGNVRKLPRPTDPARGGGYGMYYHFDYVGGPRNYKWLNTNPIARVWEEMHLTKAYGDDRIWIVNVGDIKPMEFPISFFLDYAWDPNRWPASKLADYTRAWATQQFGPRFADSIAYILDTYTKYNGRRKPELLSSDTYSLLHYREADKVVADYNRLAVQAESIGRELPAEARDAYFELVLYPVLACANLNELYVTAALNKLYAAQGRAATNVLAQRVRELFDKDSVLAVEYNRKTAGGKWNHMMDQTHIGYTNWQEPRYNNMPVVTTLDTAAVSGPPWGVAIEGSASWWSGANDTAAAILPPFYPYRQDSCYIDVFVRGNAHFAYKTFVEFPWVKVRKADSEQMEKEQRFWVSIDWAHAPSGRHQALVGIIGPDNIPVSVTVRIDNPAGRKPGQFKGFIETNGCISIEAQHFVRAVGSDSVQWLVIPNLGRTLSGVHASPVTVAAQVPGEPVGQRFGEGRDRPDNPHLEYPLYLFDTGMVKVRAYFSPILAFNRQPIRYAISIDDGEPQLIDLSTGNEASGTWDRMVADNIRISVSSVRIGRPGPHMLKYWLVDPSPVLQKIVVDAGGVLPSYLGPPESPTDN